MSLHRPNISDASVMYKEFGFPTWTVTHERGGQVGYFVHPACVYMTLSFDVRVETASTVRVITEHPLRTSEFLIDALTSRLNVDMYVHKREQLVSIQIDTAFSIHNVSLCPTGPKLHLVSMGSTSGKDTYADVCHTYTESELHMNPSSHHLVSNQRYLPYILSKVMQVSTETDLICYMDFDMYESLDPDIGNLARDVLQQVNCDIVVPMIDNVNQSDDDISTVIGTDLKTAHLLDTSVVILRHNAYCASILRAWSKHMMELFEKEIGMILSGIMRREILRGNTPKNWPLLCLEHRVLSKENLVPSEIVPLNVAVILLGTPMHEYFQANVRNVFDKYNADIFFAAVDSDRNIKLNDIVRTYGSRIKGVKIDAGTDELKNAARAQLYELFVGVHSLAETYELTHDMKYDVIVAMHDVSVTEPLRIDRNNIHTLQSQQNLKFSVDPHFFYANRNVMRHIAKAYQEFDSLCNDSFENGCDKDDVGRLLYLQSSRLQSR